MKKVLLLKAHVSSYTKKDGTFVAEHEDKRTSASGGKFAQLLAKKKAKEAELDRRVAAIMEERAKRPDAEKEKPAPAAEQRPAPKKQEDETVRLYHGSDEERIPEIEDTGPFRGLFASDSKKVALSHGSGHLHTMDVSSDKIATRREMRNLSGRRLTTANKIIREHARKEKLSKSDLQLLRDAVLDEAEVHDMDEADAARIQALLGTIDGLAEASWKIQMIRGQVARAMGYQAVEMTDEHGVSYLVLPGTKVTPHNDGIEPMAKSMRRVMLVSTEVRQ